MARPMRSNPEELAEELMQSELKKKMSRRDIARKQFIDNFRRRQMEKGSLKAKVSVEMNRYR